ncbi:cbs domain containing protein [Algoriphagus sediminis]|uniref:Cbs domain containing protein n=1 Tax=Algoriphagus sediminis TaxID=3057113 RepID=A0ABT7YEC2_9BACT|nr:cbs domain containing protein [Algoriphagus sediminis]MDN3204873.1 cbs domain containing protein [Algoriphagus sediminis]
MQASEFITDFIPPLKLSDKVSLALAWMEEIRTAVLPVVDQGKFLGFVRDEVILDLNDLGLTIAEIELDGLDCKVYGDQHVYEILKAGAENGFNAVAILNREDIYQGVVTIEDSLTAFAESLSIQATGSVLVLSMEMTDYSLSEIARLVETENGKILSSIISSDPLDSSKIKLTLKIDQPELRHIKATLERFGYKIIDHFEEEAGISSEEDRIGNLLRFLDI